MFVAVVYSNGGLQQYDDGAGCWWNLAFVAICSTYTIKMQIPQLSKADARTRPDSVTAKALKARGPETVTAKALKATVPLLLRARIP